MGIIYCIWLAMSYDTMQTCMIVTFYCINTIHIASGTKLSIAVGTTCVDGHGSSQNHVVFNSPVNLTCCIGGSSCLLWNISWYRNASNELISHDQVLSINLDEPQETFLCVAEVDIPDLLCYDYSQYQATITLVQGTDMGIRISY